MPAESQTASATKRKSPRRASNAAAEPRRHNRTPGSMTRSELNDEIRYELEKVLLVTLRRPAFKRLLGENPELLLNMKKLVDRGQPPVKDDLYTEEAVVKLIGTLAVHQPAALLHLAGEKGRAQLRALLVQNG